MDEKENQKQENLLFYNVTEARAHFAEVLKENQKVLITWHGHPIKIILDYKEYLAILKK